MTIQDRVALIQKICAEEFGITLNGLLGKSRKKHLITPRHVAMWIARTQIIGVSYPLLGVLFKRDHSTVITGVQHAETILVLSEKIDLLTLKCIKLFNQEENPACINSNSPPVPLPSASVVDSRVKRPAIIKGRTTGLRNRNRKKQ